MREPPLFRFDDAADFGRVRDVLAAAGYDDAGVVGLLGAGPASSADKKLPVLLHRTRHGSPLETLVRLFILGVRVGRDEARAALAPLEPGWWAERGLLTVSGDEVEATVQLRCYQGLLVAFDFHRRGGSALRRDHVMGISASSLTLAGLTVRRPNASALDLGTGSGFQALLAAQHSERVVATDRNPRAVQMAAFNAGLCGHLNVECRQGDLFAPVVGEEFDLIVSNPPFVVSPEDRYYFLHSGRPADEACRIIARRAGRHLRPGGYCQFLANWTIGSGEDWRDKLAGWLEGAGCDALVLRRSSMPPDEYAAEWIETEGGAGAFARSFEEWMEYYRRLDVEAVDSGFVTMRRTEGQPWFRAEDAPDTMTFPAGGDLVRAFEGQDFLAAHSDDASLLGARVRLAPDVRLDQQYRQAGGDWEAVASRLHRVEGFHWSGGIDPYGAGLLSRCDGSRTIGELLDELASSLGEEAAGMAPRWPALVRRLVQQGFLLPA